MAAAVPEPRCPLDGCPIQRPPEGDLLAGFDLHIEIVHPDATGDQERQLQVARRRFIMRMAAEARR